jgi:magnesium-transporting ATPase (P-type)
VERDANLTGDHVGTAIDVARAANGDVEALLVRLDNDKVVWIVMTGLRFGDLRHIADQRL